MIVFTLLLSRHMSLMSQGSNIKSHTKSLGDTAGIMNGNITAMNGTEMGHRWLNGSEGIQLSTQGR